jgi:hypothetical protein
MSDKENLDTDRAINTAWSVHSALGDWTGRVDGKASIFLTLEAALLAAIINASGHDGRLAKGALETRLECITYWAGVSLICASIVFAAGVVTPQLRRWASRKGGTEWKKNIVYFGHLRHWDPVDLKRELLNQPEALESLSRQMVRMSKISWRKHSWAQASMALAALGGGSIVWCLLLVR